MLYSISEYWSLNALNCKLVELKHNQLDLSKADFYKKLYEAQTGPTFALITSQCSYLQSTIKAQDNVTFIV